MPAPSTTGKASSTVQAADRLISAGLALCKPDAGTKNPSYAGWSARSLSPDDFAEGDLIGILGGPLSDCNLPGHALVVLDLDAAEAIKKADAHLPATGMIDGRPGKYVRSGRPREATRLLQNSLAGEDGNHHTNGEKRT
jgi:hypothetical protein